MAPPSADSLPTRNHVRAKSYGASMGENVRRKSVQLFSRASLSGLTQINTDVANSTTQGNEKKDAKKLSKRTSIFGIGPSASPDLQHIAMSPTDSEMSGSPRLRPKTLQKSRPSSLFGSMGRRSMRDVEVGEADNPYSATPDSPFTDGPAVEQGPASSKTVLHYGEVQTTSGMFRKKKEFLVLTDTHLVRFKSQNRASETFPSIPQVFGGRNTTRHPSSTSIGSLQDVQSNNSRSSIDSESWIPLSQIITAYKVEDGRPFFTTDVVYLDEEYQGAGSIQLMLHDPKEADLWHGSIRAAAQKARLLMTESYPERIVRYLVQSLESVHDYDAEHFKVFRVVRRSPLAKGKASADDLQKLGSSVYYLVIGINRLHLIPIPDYSDASRRLIRPKTGKSMYGLVTLCSMNVNYSDDRFEIGFRIPFHPVKSLELAASATPDIAIVIYKATQYLKPQWLDYSFSFHGPRQLLDDSLVQFPDDEYGSFDRTLIAYCMAYNCDPTNVRYAIDWEVEDAPEFRLYTPARAAAYTVLELLAIMRALRYNESFHSISFKDINLRSLHGLKDFYGTDLSWSTREGTQLQTYFGTKLQFKSLLYQEVQALALKSRKVRRMDFSNTLPRKRVKNTNEDENERESGSEIVAAIFPLLRAHFTNLSWILLNDVELGDIDLEEIIPALDHTDARIRAIECQHSGLNDRELMQLLKHMEKQGNSIEYINLANNPGRIHLGGFHISMSRFTRIRRLNLYRMTRTEGEEPLFLPEVMLSWKLEELILTGIPVNKKTLESISGYLASEMSENLAVLEMEQCSLTGYDVALLMRSMTRVPGKARNLQLQVSANRLEKGVREIVAAIKENATPSHLIVRMIEFTKENHFRTLLQALRTNTTIRYLDLSKASLPADASPETCEALRLMFVDNSTLEELDISGEHAHLEITRFGIGLNQALTGLEDNKSLKALRIEYQNLGLEGANTLATVFKSNKSLTYIQCDHNNISLQGFTILVNSIANNFTVLEVPFMRDDQDESIKKLELNMQNARRVHSQAEKRTPLHRTMSVLGVTKHPKQDIALSAVDVNTAVREITDMWKCNMDRLSMFLERNRKLALGEDVDGLDGVKEVFMRPTTAMSDRGVLEHVLNNTTPKIELENPHETNNYVMVPVYEPDSDEEENTIIDQTTPKNAKPAKLAVVGEQGANKKGFETKDVGVFEMEDE